MVKTHKSSNGNNFATPPRTMNTATAKFTMRLKTPPTVSKRLPRNAFSCLGSVAQPTHKISEKSMAEDELAKCGNRSLTTL
jgi:hypothetical protein